jgi:uncharacterized protein HemY
MKQWHIRQAELNIKIALANPTPKTWWMGAAYHFEQAGMAQHAKACRELAK